MGGCNWHPSAGVPVLQLVYSRISQHVTSHPPHFRYCIYIYSVLSTRALPRLESRNANNNVAKQNNTAQQNPAAELQTNFLYMLATFPPSETSRHQPIFSIALPPLLLQPASLSACSSPFPHSSSASLSSSWTISCSCRRFSNSPQFIFCLYGYMYLSPQSSDQFTPQIYDDTECRFGRPDPDIHVGSPEDAIPTD